jgi:replication factor A1
VIQVVLQRARPDGSKMRQVRIAECIVGDETGVIVFTARTLPNSDQGKSADSRFAQNASIPL